MLTWFNGSFKFKLHVIRYVFWMAFKKFAKVLAPILPLK